ncbi:hypothetical protein [Bradyrhizobium septentrionale]|uniref:Uncharacterized protein n=1 Tax=Bradyrhizobium septentrionale TaxID=1404411 RepID=A0A973W5M4_9BRAD|nr:hypothetical protein [Bradyrhizobium septentrionale]UGY16731.1 hypothetical protein HAP48_0004040 [Bradyrhizobium septentrionale]UGY25388.1 hypothetical protein HU675_0047400 [Bradyrhizobium septentrionale]
MAPADNLNELMVRFRIASREIFNQFFRVEGPYENDGWSFEQRFSEVEAILFDKMVAEPASLGNASYGSVTSAISVELRIGKSVPAMINREINSGYWDHPIGAVTADAQLQFISFFDWDRLNYRDNQYVRVCIARWPSHKEMEGKEALLEAQYVQFRKSND